MSSRWAVAGTLALAAWMTWSAGPAGAEKKDLHAQALEVLLSLDDEVADLRKALRAEDIGEARSATKRALARIDRCAALVTKAGATSAEEVALGFIADGRRYLEEVLLLIDDAEVAYKESLKAAKLAEKKRIEELRAAVKAGKPVVEKSDDEDDEDDGKEEEEEPEVVEEWQEILDEAVLVLRDGRVIIRRGVEAFPRRR